MGDGNATEGLVKAAGSRDRAAVESLLVQQLPTLRGWLRLRMGATLRARLTADDLVQSVAREALADLADFEWRGEAAFRHWLYARAQNKLLERARFVGAEKRNPGREAELPADESQALLDCYANLCTPSRGLQSAEAMRRIEDAFDGLDEDYREAITLYRLCKMSYAEIAAKMQRSEGAVRNLVYRGLSRLALRLGQADPSA
ncbi:MAG: sigma-70 family RNA polymerase sigma factor [Planctomycetes bacterium]|nr:sigma-70 family RNA polymerase sigma factor [Planctomycetota bacterium]